MQIKRAITCSEEINAYLYPNHQPQTMQEPIVIGFDAKRACQNSTGLGNYSRFVLSGLSRRASSLRLLLYAPNPQKTRYLNGLDNAPAVEMRFPMSKWWKRLRSLWRVWGMTHDLERDGIQLYHGLSNELPLNIRRARGIKTIVTIHDLIFLRYPQSYKTINRWIYHYKFRRACRVADRIIAVSECTKRDIIRFFHTPAEKIKVVYQGCDEQFRSVATQEQKDAVRQRYQLPDRYILFVGSIEERKNLMLLAQAFALLPDNDIHVVAVGKRTRYANRVQAFIDSQALGSRFHMLNDVLFSELPALYQMAAVFVYPSRFEGFGIPLLEALCCGTPVIGCTGSCLEEAGGPSSIYVDPDDEQALARAIQRVLSDEVLRRQMITAGHEYAERFLEEQLHEDLTGLYRQVLMDDRLGKNK